MTGKEILKVVAVIIGLGVVLLGIVVAFGAYWWKNNGNQFLAAGKAAQQQGTAEGAHLGEKDCLDQAVARHRGDSSLGTSVTNNLRLISCFDASHKNPGFCDGVPGKLAFTSSINWRVAQCNRLHLSDPNCGNLFGAMQDYCNSARRKAKADAAAEPPLSSPAAN